MTFERREVSGKELSLGVEIDCRGAVWAQSSTLILSDKWAIEFSSTARLSSVGRRLEGPLRTLATQYCDGVFTAAIDSTRAVG